MTPAEAEAKEPGATYIVIDAVRATTTIAALFHRGLRRLRVVGTRRGTALAGRGDVILFGEEGGLRPAGFDYGNSPAEAAALDWRAVRRSWSLPTGRRRFARWPAWATVAAGALVNLTALADLAGTHGRVVVVCAGNAGARTFALEDFAVGACLVAAPATAAPGCPAGRRGTARHRDEGPGTSHHSVGACGRDAPPAVRP
ncbi:MAG: 2-phosphosulfolactate phosphatase [Dehalococcoidia bacterium]|nr:2-phosphosulfolactate phosphatase [Dehalococcoidia bacterium]